MRCTLCFQVALGLATICLATTGSIWAQAPDLFGEPASAKTNVRSARQISPYAKRSRSASLNRGALAAGAVRLNLFSGVAYDGFVLLTGTSQDGKSEIYTGKIASSPNSQVTMTVSGDEVTGNITTETGTRYLIRSGAILEADSDSYLEEKEPLRPPSALGKRTGLPSARVKAALMETGIHDQPEAPAAGLEDTEVVTINIAVLYTQGVLDSIGSEEDVRRRIHMVVAETNQIYIDSGIHQRIELVHTALVPAYNEYGDSMADTLMKLTTGSDSGIGDAASLRRRSRADLISLWTNQTDACGIAWVLNGELSPYHSFSVVNHFCATDNYTFAHEIGHNMGAMHNREASTIAGYLQSSYGYRKPGPDGFRTVMSYSCSDIGENCGRVGLFSSPLRRHNDEAAGLEGDADNADTLNATRRMIIQLRDANRY